MATVKLLVRGKKNPSPITLRFSSGNLDIWAKSKVLVNPLNWDNKNGKLRNLNHIVNRDKKNITFEKLKNHIVEVYNDAFMSGLIIDKNYLESEINKYFNRPIEEYDKNSKDHFIFYSDFSYWWLEQKAQDWKVGANKFISKRQIQQYQSFVDIFKDFQGIKKVRLKDLDHKKVSDFVDYLESENYSYSTIKRYIGRLKFFLNRAEEINGVNIDNSFKQKVFINKQDDNITEPYLNELEIQKIYNLDLSNDISLDNIRDNFIISLWSGLRISDFNNNLNIDNIKDDYIEIKTVKTKAWVTLPLHPQIKAILKKRFGNLPARTSNKDYNERIKIICMLCDIDKTIKGKLMDSTIGRKKIGMFKKWQLISSHVGRRSFVTNLYGNIPNSTLVKLGGWTNEVMMLHYIKKTNKEHADTLKSFWASKYKTHEK